MYVGIEPSKLIFEQKHIFRIGTTSTVIFEKKTYLNLKNDTPTVPLRRKPGLQWYCWAKGKSGRQMLQICFYKNFLKSFLTWLIHGIKVRYPFSGFLGDVAGVEGTGPVDFKIFAQLRVPIKGGLQLFEFTAFWAVMRGSL